MSSTRRLHPLTPLLPLLLLDLACAAQHPMNVPSMTPLPAAGLAAPTPAPLAENHFLRDRSSAVTPAALATILAAPTYLEVDARVGVLPVSTGYGADEDVPLTQVPGLLGEALDDSGLFEGVSEVSTDFPSDGSLAGLRELAARYRAEYLLLYRHRFVDDAYANPWAASYLTLVTIPFAPGHTLETTGVVEATLLDVKSGTLLFTVFERVHAKTSENVWQHDRKRRELKEQLLADATRALTEQVMVKIRRLVSARPGEVAAAGAKAGRDRAEDVPAGAPAPTPLGAL